MIGWLNDIEGRGMLWIQNKVKSGAVNVKAPKDEHNYVVLEIISSSTKLEPEIKDGRLKMKISIKEECNLQSQATKLDMTKEETIKELEKRSDDVIQSEINAALDKAQKEWGTDIFMFGEQFHRKYPEQWPLLKDRWEELYKEVEVELKIESKIQRFYNITSVFEKKEW